jgi:hypothetical protein
MGREHGTDILIAETVTMEMQRFLDEVTKHPLFIDARRPSWPFFFKKKVHGYGGIT